MARHRHPTINKSEGPLLHTLASVHAHNSPLCSLGRSKEVPRVLKLKHKRFGAASNLPNQDLVDDDIIIKRVGGRYLTVGSHHQDKRFSGWGFWSEGSQLPKQRTGFTGYAECLHAPLMYNQFCTVQCSLFISVIHFCPFTGF